MNKVRLSALLTLLLDEDETVASLAMEQFLKLGSEVEKTIAEYQESNDPRLRHRIHQLSSILARRRRREDFVSALSREELSLWEGMVQLNLLCDPECARDRIHEELVSLSNTLDSGQVTTPQVAESMREKEYTVPSEDVLDLDLYLIERVLDSRYGSAAVLCALALQAGSARGWSATVVLHAGRFCLIDRNNLLLDPSEGWHISKLKAADRIHPCSRRDVLLGILSQLFLVSLIDGQLRDLHNFGSLLTALNESSAECLPFPLGGGDVPVA